MDTQLLKPRKRSVGQGPRPNPDGMAATQNGTNTDDVTIRIVGPGNVSLLQDANDDERLDDAQCVGLSLIL